LWRYRRGELGLGHRVAPVTGRMSACHHRAIRALATSAFVLACAAPGAGAQRVDSSRVAPRARVDTVMRAAPLPPLSRLGRPIAGGIFALTETIAIAMLRESQAELREARLFRQDTLVNLGNDPATGAVVLQRTSYNDELISIRRGHVEDWIAFLVGNHLFAGADAYVGAHLWDLPSQVSVEPTPYGPAVVARIRW
jgi:hypothetical protein